MHSMSLEHVSTTFQLIDFHNSQIASLELG